MQRMMFDVFKRQTKEKRIGNLLDKHKPKINEYSRVNTFNRLIEDANRRLEAAEKMDSMKNNLNSELNPMKKSVGFKDWDKIYQERFLKYKKEKEDILEKRIIDKEKGIKEEEDKIIQEINNKTKKMPKKVVENIVNRMYCEAEKREIVKEEKIKEIEKFNEKLQKDQSRKNSLGVGVCFRKSTDEEQFQNREKFFNKPTEAFKAKVTKKVKKEDEMKKFKINKNKSNNFRKCKYSYFNYIFSSITIERPH
jgi:hypothetical protein